MKVCVIGSGYVGLVAGACFAEYGNDIICVDIDEKKINNLKNGIIPIYEPGLSEMVSHNVRRKRLSFTTSLQEGVEKSDIIFIAVGTPTGAEGEADLSMVLSVAKEIGKAMNGYKIIVDKSTVPVGTADKVKAVVSQETKHPFDVVSNPEFLKEGVALEDFMRPERVVIGADTELAGNAMKELYAPFVLNGNPILLMSIKSAEITKYACNAFLATKISFANEIANLCDKVGANYDDVRYGMGTDSRIGKKFLYAGIGYGGLAFKPDTDDMREAPSIPIISELHRLGVNLQAYDPEAVETSKYYFDGKVKYVTDAYEALDGAEALLLLTEWREFREPDFNRVKKFLTKHVIFDGRNLYKKPQMNRLGFTHYGIGMT